MSTALNPLCQDPLYPTPESHTLAARDTLARVRQVLAVLEQITLANDFDDEVAPGMNWIIATVASAVWYAEKLLVASEGKKSADAPKREKAAHS
jgi:hypothetical protein